MTRVWEIALRRPCFDWEKSQWDILMNILESIPIRKFIPDMLAWSFCKDGKFSVGSFRTSLEDFSFVSLSNTSLIWQGVCPSKVEIFL